MEVNFIIFLCLLFTDLINCTNITFEAFGGSLDGIPAAFCDFDSNDFIDIFMLRDKAKTLELLLASDSYKQPLLGLNKKCPFRETITSVVPGNFDGDLSMDVLVTTSKSGLTNVHILWGRNGGFDCLHDEKPFIKMQGQPLAIDYNNDLIIDLFGSNEKGQRCFWIFNSDRTTPLVETMDKNFPPIRNPHSNAFLDLNNDFYSDLMITTNTTFEIWNGGPNGGFKLSTDKPWPTKIKEMTIKVIGQSLYLDLERKGELNLILPVCFDEKCLESAIVVNKNGVFYETSIHFHNAESGELWGFLLPHQSDGKNVFYSDAITLRGGDFDMDGYPDLLATFQNRDTGVIRSFLLYNNPCIECEGVSRNFKIDWHSLIPSSTIIMAAFYDFYQDGMMDMILVEYDEEKDKYQMSALKNNNDHYSTFMNVMVLTGSTSLENGGVVNSKKIGSNLPGPSISYTMTETKGGSRTAIAAQLPQSAHFSLNLPYTSFGLGDTTSNNVDELVTGVAGKSHKWEEIIPNSQLIVIPNLTKEGGRWKILPFAIPKNLMMVIATALITVSAGIFVIIAVLWWKERRQDRFERMQNAMSFHFDAL